MGSGDLDSLLKELNIVKNLSVRIESLGEQPQKPFTYFLSIPLERESWGENLMGSGWL